jgi:hypothetical protein
MLMPNRSALVTMASGETGIEEDGGSGAAGAHGDQGGEAVLGHQTDLGGSGLELGCRRDPG